MVKDVLEKGFQEQVSYFVVLIKVKIANVLLSFAKAGWFEERGSM